MAAPSSRDELAKACRTAQLIGGAMLVGLGLSALVVNLIQRTHAPFGGFVPGAPHDLLRWIFAALALVGFALYCPRRQAWDEQTSALARDAAVRAIRPPGT